MEFGTRIGGYELLRYLGIGTVYEAVDVVLGRRAAIKVLRSAFGARPEILVRSFDEIRAVTAIADPGIVQIFDFGQHTDGSAYIAMELLEGETLRQRLHERRQLPIADALSIMHQITSTLDVAHRRGIAHLDLEPANIFLVRDSRLSAGERAKVLNFGIAKLRRDLLCDNSLVQAGTVTGTPRYMSPEQCSCSGEIDQRSDIYSLGCILFELITGAVPFDRGGPVEVIAMHLREPPPLLANRVTGIAPELEALMQRCLAKAPRDRYASGAELSAAIGRMLGRPRNAFE